MTLVIKATALNVIRDVAQWINSQNLPDTGEKWVNTLEQRLIEIAAVNPPFKICKDPKLARYQYDCFTYADKWVVAYKIIGERFVVYRFLLGAKLAY